MECPRKTLPNYIRSSPTHRWHVHVIDALNENVQSHVSLPHDSPGSTVSYIYIFFF